MTSGGRPKRLDLRGQDGALSPELLVFLGLALMLTGLVAVRFLAKDSLVGVVTAEVIADLQELGRERVEHETKMNVLVRHARGWIGGEHDLAVNFQPPHSGLDPCPFGLSHWCVIADNRDDGLSISTNTDPRAVYGLVSGVGEQWEVPNLETTSDHDIDSRRTTTVLDRHSRTRDVPHGEIIKRSTQHVDVRPRLQGGLFGQMPEGAFRRVRLTLLTGGVPLHRERIPSRENGSYDQNTNETRPNEPLNVLVVSPAFLGDGQRDSQGDPCQENADGVTENVYLAQAFVLAGVFILGMAFGPMLHWLTKRRHVS